MRKSWKWYHNFTMLPDLHISQSPTARVVKLPDGTWHLEIPANTRRVYRLAQLDDHRSLRRDEFPWKSPLKFSLMARVSAQNLPGTWGFGLWNDPFSFLISYNNLAPRLPTLPQAAWFFNASQESYLSFRDDLPANGFLAATFHSQKIPTALLLLTSPILALSLIRRAAQVTRSYLHRRIHQDSALINTDVTGWHEYCLEWEPHTVSFGLDGNNILQTKVTPDGPLSLVIWVDNQFAALPPKGRLRFGNLPTPEPAWLEVRDLSVQDNHSG